MSIVQILLLILGVLMFIISFFIPDKNSRLSKEDRRLTERQIRDLVQQEMQGLHERVADVVDETVSYAVEKAERSMEKLTNEKIMAVNEYSDTVLEDIHKNHEEVVFLYDMLNDKHKDLTTVASRVEKTAREAKNVVTASDYVNAPPAGESGGRSMGPASMGGTMSGAGQVQPSFTPFMVQTVDMNREKESVLRVPSGPVMDNPDIMDTVSHGMGIRDESASSESGDYLNTDIDPNSNDRDSQPKKRGRKPSKNKEAADREAGAGDAGTAGRNSAAGSGTPTDGNREIRVPEFPRVDRSAVALSFQGNQDDNKNNNQRILQLHKEGKSNVAIARELGLGVGEVKLVIDLFK